MIQPCSAGGTGTCTWWRHFKCHFSAGTVLCTSCHYDFVSAPEGQLQLVIPVNQICRKCTRQCQAHCMHQQTHWHTLSNTHQQVSSVDSDSSLQRDHCKVLPSCNDTSGNQAVAAAILPDLHRFMHLQRSNATSQSSGILQQQRCYKKGMHARDTDTMRLRKQSGYTQHQGMSVPSPYLCSVLCQPGREPLNNTRQLAGLELLLPGFQQQHFTLHCLLAHLPPPQHQAEQAAACVVCNWLCSSCSGIA